MTTSTMTTEIEDIAQDQSAADTTRKASIAAHKAIDSLVDPAATAERKVRDLVSRAEQTTRDGKERVATRAESLLEDASDYAKKKPLAAAGISFAAGLLLSRLFRS